MTKSGIIWLASYPKSGNTWTRNFLYNLINVMKGIDDPEALGINRIRELTTWELAGMWYEGLITKPLEEHTKREIAVIRPRAQQRIADSDDGLALVKTHNALVSDRGTPTINFKVTSGAIYIVRNPLDVAISLSHHINDTIDTAIERMNLTGLETPISKQSVHEIWGSWSQNVGSWTAKPHKAIYVMRYEDMKADPERTFGKLARHLLMRPSRRQLLKAIELSSFNRLKAQEEDEGFFEKPKEAKRFFREGRSGQWRERLTAEQIGTIVEANRVQMERFGYVPAEVA